MCGRRAFIVVVLAGVLPVLLHAQEKPDALELHNEGRYEEAIRICLWELEQTPKNMNSYSVLGWSLIELGRYDEALEYARAGLQISRGDYRIVETAAEALYYKKEYEQALKYFEEYVVLAPFGEKRIDNVYYFMGECYINLREYQNADIALSTALYFQPNIALWWARLGYAREMAGDLSWSLDAYDRALRLNPLLREAREGKNRVEQRLDRREG